MNSTTAARRRPISWLLAFLLILAALVSIGGVRTASADTTLCSGSGYSTCTDAGYTDHGFAGHYSNSYWGAYPGHNCTNYVAYVLQTVNGAPAPGYLLGDGSTWDDNASAHGIPVDSTPAIGAVAQWNTLGGSSGHVAYVEAVNSDGSITVSQDVYASGPFSWKVISAGSSGWPDHFIHFKDLTGYQSVSGDFNGDGAADLALRDTTSGMIYIRFGPYFNQIEYQWAAGIYFQFFVGDFDHNGASDLALRDTGAGTIYIRYSSSTGFGNQTTFNWASGTYFQSLSGDFNHDGYADLVLRDTGSGTFYIRYGPSFAGQATFSWAPGAYLQALSGDFNHDGYSELVLRDTGSGWFYIRFGPAFTNQSTFQWAPGAYFQSTAGDFNADGYADLVLRDKVVGMFYIRFGTSFTSQTTYYWPATG